MSKCDLSIHLDDPERRYTGGGPVTGRVRVQVNSECECKALTLTMLWRTHGKGNRAEGGEQEFLLHQGDWLPGKVHEYEFAIDAPAGPPTYRGTIVNLDWYLKARADIPWAFDPKAEEEFLLEAGPDAAPQRSREEELEELHPFAKSMLALQDGSPGGLSGVGGRHGRLAMGCFIAILAPFVLIGLGLTISGFSGVFGEQSADGPGAMGYFLIPFGLLMILAPAFVLLRMFRNRIASSRLGPVTVEIDPTLATSGDPLTVRLSIDPAGEVELESIEAALVATEVAVSGSGTNETTHTHEFHRENLSLSGQRVIRPGQTVEYEERIVLPADAVASFRVPYNNVSWCVVATVKVPRWPDFEKSVEVTVQA